MPDYDQGNINRTFIYELFKMTSAKNISKDFRPNIFHPFYFIRRQLYDKISHYAAELHGDVLDFGCGAKPYKSLFGHCTSYIGVDFEGAGHNYLNEEIDFFYDGKTLPFADEAFDCIFCSEVFEHLFNLPELLKELNRVIKKGGKLLVTCPFAWPEHEKPYDYARYTVFALKEMLGKSDFEVRVEDKSGNFFLAVHQLNMVYVYQHICGKFSFNNRIPFLASAVRSLLVPLMNIGGIIGNAILPANREFYLNNIILAEKTSK